MVLFRRFRMGLPPRSGIFYGEYTADIWRVESISCRVRLSKCPALLQTNSRRCMSNQFVVCMSRSHRMGQLDWKLLESAIAHSNPGLKACRQAGPTFVDTGPCVRKGDNLRDIVSRTRQLVSLEDLPWYVNIKPRPFPRFTLSSDVAFVILNDPLHNRQTNAGSFVI
jgi:hypothetical protein